MLPGMSLICCGSIEDTWPLSLKRIQAPKHRKYKNRRATRKRKNMTRKTRFKKKRKREAKADG